LGVRDNPEWKLLIEYTRLQDTQGHSLYSKDYIHHLTSLHTILLGFNLLESNSINILKNGIRILENIPYYVKNKQSTTDGSDLIKECIQKFLEKSKDLINLNEVKYKNINEWLNRISIGSINAFSENEMDDIVSLKSIITGAYFNFDKNIYSIYTIFELCIFAILKREEEWYKAVEEFHKIAIIKKVKPLNIVGVESTNQLIIKAARLLVRSDILIYRNHEDSSTTIFLHKNGPLNKFRLNKLAGLIRIIESYLNNEKPDYEKIANVGNVNGWFLHQSECLLIKGSPKATNFVPSKIPLLELTELVCYFVDRKKDNTYNLPNFYYKLILEYENPIFRKMN
jgi:hypothetical protein